MTSQSITWVRLLVVAPLVTLAVLASGCGTATSNPSASTQARAPLAPWPSAADYQTIRTAIAVRDQALFHQADWRRKSFAADLALSTLLTVRIGSGRCAAYVTELYGTLRDLGDAYPRENWRPLVRAVRHQPPLAAACAHLQPAAAFPTTVPTA